MACDNCKSKDGCKVPDGFTPEMIEALERDLVDRKKTRRVSIICATICLVSVLLFAGILGVLASGIQIERTTEETTQTVEGDSAIINNSDFEQFNDNATKGGE